MDTTPPPMLESSKLVKYARVDSSVMFTGHQVLYVDGKLLGAVPQLAICQNLADKRMHLLLCDENWNVIGASTGDTVDELEENAEHWYRGIKKKWIQSPYSDEDFMRYIEDQRGQFRCSFCGRWDWEFGELFSDQDCNICDICVRSFFNILEGRTNSGDTMS